MPLLPYSKSVLPATIRSRFLRDINGLTFHILEAGENDPNRPLVLLLHGFPELAYSWRKIMPILADHGYYVIAPDQRGYGRTFGWDNEYDTDLRKFRLLNLVRDVLGILQCIGHQKVEAIVGHDFGASVAAYLTLIRPDVVRSMVLMSAPFSGPPSRARRKVDTIHTDLKKLERPRKHYQWYYSTREANGDMSNCNQGVHNFLRAYFHHKSADWSHNKPYLLTRWSADELAKMPKYYIMDMDKDMPQTVFSEMPSSNQIASNLWLPEHELEVYSIEYERSGFQGGLNWYRCRTNGINDELDIFSGLSIEVPSCFISGAADWGVYQVPGALEVMQKCVCQDFRGSYVVPEAGHWVQQEKPSEVNRHLLNFLSSL